MDRVRIADVDPVEVAPGVDCRRLADPLGASDLAVNRYRVPPGGGFPGGLHAHGDQEEVFVVLAGEATFETLPGSGAGGDGTTGELVVGEGEVVRFAPGEYQSGYNAGDDPLVALALGAPRGSEDVRVPLSCPGCGHGYLHPDAGDDGVSLDCPACGAENVPDGCPDCGAEMRVTLGDRRRTVVECPDCGREAPTPFDG